MQMSLILCHEFSLFVILRSFFFHYSISIQVPLYTSSFTFIPLILFYDSILFLIILCLFPLFLGFLSSKYFLVLLLFYSSSCLHFPTSFYSSSCLPSFPLPPLCVSSPSHLSAHPISVFPPRLLVPILHFFPSHTGHF